MSEPPTPTPPAQGTAAPRSRRVLWRSLAVALALVVGLLLLAAYRQPDLMLQLANLGLC